MTLDEQLPIANWPTKSGVYKVVQLYINKNPHLRFAKMADDWETHAAIIISLAHELRKKYPKIKKRGLPYGKDKIPALKSEWYNVCGMGNSKVNVEKRQVSFYGNSLDYGIGIDKQYLNSIKLLIPDWTVWTDYF